MADDSLAKLNDAISTIKAVPGGTVNVRINAPSITGISFKPEKVRCGDKVTVVANLSCWEYVGKVHFTVRSGSDLVEHWVDTRGKTQVTCEWVSLKKSNDWSASAVDARVTAALVNSAGGEVSTKEVPLTITRPPPGKKKNCVDGFFRMTNLWTFDINTMKWKKSGKRFAMLCNYDLSFDDHAATVTGKVKLLPQKGLTITSAMKAAWKAEIEATWNGKFRAHRKSCGRGAGCTCTHDCCQFDVKIVCEFVEGNDYHVEVKVYPGEADPDRPWNMEEWWEKAPDVEQCVRAHEFGHAIGVWDDYKIGKIPPWMDPNIHDMPNESIMKKGNEVMPHHFDDWLSELAKLTSDTYTVVPINK